MSEATERYERIKSAVEWPRDKNGYISFAAERAHEEAMLWALNQFSREEYFGQDIGERIAQAQMVLRCSDLEGRLEVWRDAGCGIDVMDVLHDAWCEIVRLRGVIERTGLERGEEESTSKTAVNAFSTGATPQTEKKAEGAA